MRDPNAAPGDVGPEQHEVRSDVTAHRRST